MYSIDQVAIIVSARTKYSDGLSQFTIVCGMSISPPPTKHVAFEGVELELYCDMPQQRNRRQSAIQSVIGTTREGSQAVSQAI